MNETLFLILLPLALLVGGALTTLLLKGLFGNMAQKALRESNEQFLQLANERLGHQQTKSTAELSQNKAAIDQSMKQMTAAIEKYEKLVKSFENDRTEKYGNLQAHLNNAVSATSQLQQTTNQLTSILANVKLRGQWGERMAEDILRISGFSEEVHYRKNKTQDTSASRPDYVFLLPNDWKVCMDVKFPLNNYLAFVNSKTQEEQEGFQKQFVRDVKDRIKEVTRKDYINPTENTLDCVLLFIPNEQVFGFVHEAAPGLLDDAMKQRVILCSPFTLYAVLAIVRQSFENFHFKEAAQEIMTMIVGFHQDFDKFKSRFEDLGRQLERASGKYQEITEKSYKRLDNRVKKIDDYRKGNALLDPKEASAEEINRISSLIPTSDS
jgi:DNA recombination protein RmuC